MDDPEFRDDLLNSVPGFLILVAIIGSVMLSLLMMAGVISLGLWWFA
jgi:hypothetical protein